MSSEAGRLLVVEAKAPGRPRAYLRVPILNQGPHEDNVTQSGVVPLAFQLHVRLVARLSLSRETGLVHLEVCDLGEQGARRWTPPSHPVNWF